MIRNFRHVQEKRRWHKDLYVDEEQYDIPKLRAKRSPRNLPDSYDTQWIRIPKSWKRIYKKKHQYDKKGIKSVFTGAFDMIEEKVAYFFRFHSKMNFEEYIKFNPWKK